MIFRLNDNDLLQALTEVDGMLKYLDKAENEINTAEPISIEPETLGVQLKENVVSLPFSNKQLQFEVKSID